jgi:hypothetical protein
MVPFPGEETLSLTILIIDSILFNNGPAIKGGCFTQRKHRADPGTLAAKLSRCQEGMLCPDEPSETGALVFAVFALRSLGEGGPGTYFIEHYECRGTSFIASR